MKSKAKLLKLTTAVILIFLGLLLILFDKPKTINNVSETFSDEPVEIAKFTLSDIPTEDKPKKIIIPRAEVDLEVKESEIIGGYWEVFEDVAGWGKGSSPPGYKGNQVIFAHARNGLFGSLERVSVGDEIYVLNSNEWFAYKVSEIKEVYPGNTDVIEQTEDERLTLYTCSGFNDEKRLIVVAERVG